MKTYELSGNEIVFLKDVQQYSESGTAARYKRLGLSVRQGQKIKAKMLEKDLTEKRLKTTSASRLKVT